MSTVSSSLLQVRRDDEHFRRLKPGGHGLPALDLAVEHDAVDRRTDRGLRQVGLGLVGLRARAVRASPPPRCATPTPSRRSTARQILCRAARSRAANRSRALARLASACATLARVCTARAFNSSVLMRAMISPFFTRPLKSTRISSMRPETSAPTVTLSIGCSVPVAVTKARMVATSALPLMYSIFLRGRQHPPQRRRAITTSAMRNHPPTPPPRRRGLARRPNVARISLARCRPLCSIVHRPSRQNCRAPTGLI